MPELPEVETMVRGLRPAMQAKTLTRVRVLDATMLDGCTPAQLVKASRGAQVRSIDRRGKWVVFRLDAGRGCIVIQPRMTGGFWLVPPPRLDHVRLLFDLEGRRDPVWFCDTRRLGKIAWHASDDAAASAFAHSHGPDALEIDIDDLAARLKATGRAIKPTLMDQKVLAGIGNIYADEILYVARLHPQRPAATLKADEVGRLFGAIGNVLNLAIAAEGSTFDAGYRTVLGLEGGFLAQNAVYGREGEPCRVCSTPIARLRFRGLIGRSSFVCVTCQPLGRRTRGSRSL